MKLTKLFGGNMFKLLLLFNFLAAILAPFINSQIFVIDDNGGTVHQQTEKEKIKKELDEQIMANFTKAAKGLITEEDLNAKVAELNKQIEDKAGGDDELTKKYGELHEIIKRNATAIETMQAYREAQAKQSTKEDRSNRAMNAVRHFLASDTFKNFAASPSKSDKEYYIEKEGKLYHIDGDPKDLTEKDVVDLTTDYSDYANGPAPLGRVSDVVARFPYQQRVTNVRDFVPSESTDKTFEYSQKITDFVNTNAPLAENEALPEMPFKMEAAQFDVGRIGSYVPISKRVLRSAQSVWNLVKRLLPLLYSYQEDLQVLRGDGVDDNVLGIMSDTNVRTLALTGSYVATDITAVADLGTGWVLFTFAAAHGLTDGYDLTIAASVNYNATYQVSVHTTTKLAVEATFVAEGDTSAWTGTFASPFSLDVAVPNLADAIAVGQVHLSNGQFIPTMAIINPTDAVKLFLEKDTQGRQLGRVDRLPDGTITIDGLPVITNSAVPVDTCYLGDFTQWANILDYQKLSVQMLESVNDDELKNQVRMKVESELIVANYNPLAFMTFVISTTITAITRA